MTATATDIYPVTITYSVGTEPLDADGFALGLTTVTVKATDANGNSSTKDITVTIGDLTAPVITASDLTAEATGLKTPVAMTATATDIYPVTITYSVGTEPLDADGFGPGADHGHREGHRRQRQQLDQGHHRHHRRPDRPGHHRQRPHR